MTPCDFALLAQEAYSAKPDIGKADSASRAIVRQTAGGLVVAFPGTDNLDCVAADLDAHPIDVIGIGQVHHGFWKAWGAISVDVLAAIDGRPVTLVGHSLGAAIAIMAAAAMVVGGNPPAAVYGFEPPRVSTNGSVAAVLAKVPLHLYKNGNDIVPDLPLDWQHAGPIRQVGRASLPFPNIADHAIARVIAALALSQKPSCKCLI
ncbi:alpha/beta fold hydrolase [Burkholderia multivorans]|uniref:alpha/beta fold hydrolase n=1 Tax=Burkholderia multivorans TaxID=87883 RepID=UPI000CFFD644|nr:alpha/beta fold hydrolase [Burkholderia multivorans]MCL4627505.1 alpha/beta fold hydrolase [Burkholderia multivorans]MCO1390998.1 alpha/beta fold hydrolase [Burkholderia multivorans]MDN7432466.1 alpha/beta fold hydrolase [Burkholderia multivorans]PRD86898.1 lipase [Burkholderia multivorans]PRG88715.1 lipase [Burkholderia multivorans]